MMLGQMIFINQKINISVIKFKITNKAVNDRKDSELKIHLLFETLAKYIIE